MDESDLEELLDDLLRLANDFDLRGAHWCEFIPEGEAISTAGRAALDAAVALGTALGLRHAVDLVRERR